MGKRIKSHHFTMSFLLLPPPTATSLRISQYDLEKLKRPKKSKKRPPTANHSLSNIDQQTGAHCNLQESKLRVMTNQALRLPIAETPSDALGLPACEVISQCPRDDRRSTGEAGDPTS